MMSSQLQFTAHIKEKKRKERKEKKRKEKKKVRFIDDYVFVIMFKEATEAIYSNKNPKDLTQFTPY